MPPVQLMIFSAKRGTVTHLTTVDDGEIASGGVTAIATGSFVKRIQDGESVLGVAHHSPIKIPFGSISLLATSEIDALNVTYKQDGESHKSVIMIDDFADRLSVIERVEASFGSQFSRSSERIPLASALLLPMVGLLLVVCGTWWFSYGFMEGGSLNEYQPSKNVFLFGLLKSLGPSGVLLLGTLLSLWPILVMVRLMQNRPEMIVSSRTT